MKTIAYIALGGALGSVLRYLTGLVFIKCNNTTFPIATLLTNILGCFLIGFFLGNFQKSIWFSAELRFFLVTGLCGGYTTFATFSDENIKLLQNNQITTAFLYTTISILLGFTATWAGYICTRT